MLPGGHGKSRVIATLALNALNTFSDSHVVIVTINKALSQRDKLEYEDYWIVSGVKDRL